MDVAITLYFAVAGQESRALTWIRKSGTIATHSQITFLDTRAVESRIVYTIPPRTYSAQFRIISMRNLGLVLKRKAATLRQSGCFTLKIIRNLSQSPGQNPS